MLLTACARAGPSLSGPPPKVAAADSAIRAAVANERAIDASRFSTRAIAVAPFQVFSRDTTLAVLGFGLADLLMTDLSRSAQLTVVDHLQIDALIREMGLVTSGAVDSKSAPRFGKLIGARRVVLGSLTSTGPDARLDGRVGDVATGAIRTTDVASASLGTILDAEKALAFSVFERLGVTLTPAERSLVEQRPTKSLAALLAYSRGVHAEAMGDYRGARRNFRNALQIDASFNEAQDRVNEVQGLLASMSARPVAGDLATADLMRAGSLALEGVNPTTQPRLAAAVDPAFRGPLNAIVIIVLTLP